jgi:hypothetical protein
MTERQSAVWRDVLDYNPDTGEFHWRVKTSPKAMPGYLAGCVYSNGYRMIKLGAQRALAHRLAWFFMTGEWPANEIDHINGDPDDNRWCNLRAATRSQNARNRRAKNYWRVGDKWRAGLRVDGKKKYLGFFDSEEAASVAVRDARVEHYGEFAGV